MGKSKTLLESVPYFHELNQRVFIERLVQIIEGQRVIIKRLQRNIAALNHFHNGDKRKIKITPFKSRLLTYIAETGECELIEDELEEIETTKE